MSERRQRIEIQILRHGLGISKPGEKIDPFWRKFLRVSKKVSQLYSSLPFDAWREIADRLMKIGNIALDCVCVRVPLHRASRYQIAIYLVDECVSHIPRTGYRFLRSALRDMKAEIQKIVSSSLKSSKSRRSGKHD
jgi:hypothetical protein